MSRGPQFPNPKSVVVIDDSALCRRVAATGLVRAGYKVSEAGTAEEAWLTIARELPAFVICDLMLGDKGSGMDVMTSIATMKNRPYCVAVTAMLNTTIESEALNAGFDIFFYKPYSIQFLVEIFAQTAFYPKRSLE